jgi:hypothetical protein
MSSQNGNLAIILVIILVVISLFSLTNLNHLFGYKIQLPELQNLRQKILPSQPSEVVKTSPQATPLADNTIKFDVERARVKDQVGTMTITKLRGGRSDNPTSYSALVEFKGKVTLTGDYFYVKPGGLMAEAMCFQNLDEASLAKMPKMTSDTRAVWFCFNDLGKAKKALIKNDAETGPATVVIDNYSIFYIPSEVYNTADLISVVKVGQN